MNRSRLHKNGFTLVEIMLVGVMTAILAVVFASAWAGLGQPSADALVRCQVAQEAQLAAACLAADFGGSLGSQVSGLKKNGKMSGHKVVDDSVLWLCFDGSPYDGIADWGDPDTVITYELDGDKLVRSNLATSKEFVVASNVQSMQLQEVGGGVQIQLTFSFRDVTQTYTLVAKEP